MPESLELQHHARLCVTPETTSHFQKPSLPLPPLLVFHWCFQAGGALLYSRVSVPRLLHVNSGGDVWEFLGPYLLKWLYSEFSLGYCILCVINTKPWHSTFNKWEQLIFLVNMEVTAWIISFTPGFFLSLTSLLSPFSSDCSWRCFLQLWCLWFLHSQIFYSSPFSYPPLCFRYTLILFFSCSVLIFLSSSFCFLIFTLFPLPIPLLYPSFCFIPFMWILWASVPGAKQEGRSKGGLLTSTVCKQRPFQL